MISASVQFYVGCRAQILNCYDFILWCENLTMKKHKKENSEIHDHKSRDLLYHEHTKLKKL